MIEGVVARSIGCSTNGCAVDGYCNIWNMLLCAGVCDMSVDCSLTLLGCRVAVAVIVVDFVRVMMLRSCSCAQYERNNYCCNKFFHFGLLLFIVIYKYCPHRDVCGFWS